MLSTDQRRALLLGMHEAIERRSTEIASDPGTQDITYPPGASLTDDERKSLAALDDTSTTALRKLVEDACGSVIFDLLNLIDATGDPSNFDGTWLPIELSMLRGDEADSLQAMWHDDFLESYWDHLRQT